MSTFKSKGTVLKVDVAAVLTPIAQLVELTPPGQESIDVEAPTLDQTGAGIPREMTGYVDASALDCLIYWDPALAVQAILNTNVSTAVKTTAQIVYSNTAASEFDFTLAGQTFTHQTSQRDLLKAKFGGKLDGLPVLTAAP
jgi:hypothetical protein